MKNFDLQVFAGERSALIRNMIADYLEVNGRTELCGVGFTKLDESPGAQSESTTYINETTSSSDIIGYETEFPYEFDAIPAQKALYALWLDGRDHHTGDAAQHVFFKVDLFNPIGTPTESAAEYKARKFVVSNEVSEFTGEGGQKIQASGTLHAVGDPIQGKFDTVSKTFTAGNFTGACDLDALGALTVTSAAGTSSGKTAISVTPNKGAGNSYCYKVANSASNVTAGQDVSSWTSWDGSAEITAQDGKVITVVEADANGKAVACGTATVVSAA